ncbi:MAG: transcription-repair coupling factor [Deltaproteobacteria bacterium]|nr:transcription-repair coupling factor [Deltaproteobacteria bacterium]MBW2536686.1 transcription-repair coupling factor [Deltaproteobacteria bacterium]
MPADRPTLTLADLAEQVVKAPLRSRHAATDVAGGALALLLSRLAARTERPLVVVTPDRDRAHQLMDDLSFVLPAAPAAEGQPKQVLPLLAAETSPYADVAADRADAQQRLAALLELASGQMPRVLVLNAAALTRKVLPGDVVLDHSQQLCAGAECERDELVAELVEAGYVRAPMCEDPGTLAVRGALVDVWPAGAPQPVRIELDGDTVAGMRWFDPEDQRSAEPLELCTLPPAREIILTADAIERARTRIREVCDEVNWPSSRTRALIDEITRGRLLFGGGAYLPAFVELEPLGALLPEDALFVLDEPTSVADALDAERLRARADHQEKAAEPHFEIAAFYDDPGPVERWLEGHTTLAVSSSAVTGASAEQELGFIRALGQSDDATPSLATRDQSDLQHAVTSARAAGGHRASLDPLVQRIATWREAGICTVLSARAHSQAERLELMLRNRGLEVVRTETPQEALADRSAPETVRVAVGRLARGVAAPTEQLCLVTEEEIFGSRARRRRAKAKAASRIARRSMLADLRNLDTGDHVVHVEHGIGRYLGLEHRHVGGHVVDLLAVQYAGGDKLYLPVYRLNQIQKYRGSEAAPRLDRLGGQSFSKAKAKAAKKVREMADQLLRLYAERRAASGVATPPVDDEYRAFEATFPFDETDDQARAIAEVGADLEAPGPMDRLVCGDVGFGKTEIALRSAYRVAMSGRQVALLCPTTVLAQQHHLTFESRLGDYPIEIAVLSRFQSRAEQERIVRGIRKGTIDVAIGTHRLLSKDVHFQRLGLLVVDEEQRFGVAAKERITALKANIDVLTLTATPIPRTLQMAVSGIRDLSLITTPPADRRAIRTIVTRDDPKVLRDAILRELERGGQVFFVHNRVQGLGARATAVQELVPDARVAVAHGQMSERALEQTMLDFVRGSYDVLCCTAIIENGLDIPRCNTIIVDRADLFGLAQLYQLRGRVGRSKQRAYCYVVVPPSNRFGDDARARIEALSRHTELGAGFQVAALDLDLRGAGDLLGAEQSGTVQSVGFEMFCELLEEAVHELRGEPVVHEVEPELSFDTEALLPESYVRDIGVRLSLYKRLASAGSTDDVDDLAREMEDRFGPPPIEARRLVQLMGLKTELRRLRALACEASPGRVTLHLRDDTPLPAAGLAELVQRHAGTYRLTPDMRLSRYARAGEQFPSGLEAADRMLGELAAELPPPPDK